MVLQYEKKTANRIAQIQYLCLLAAVVLELLFFILEDGISGITYMYVERYLAFPAMIFLGASLCHELSPRAKRTLILSAVMLGTFFLTQTIHQAVESSRKETGTFFFVYGMAFPFATLAGEDMRKRGMKLVSGLFLAVSVLVVVYAGLLVTGLLPQVLESRVYWDGTRFSAMGHPNKCACLMMIGMGIGLGACLNTKKRIWKVLLLVLAAGQYVVLCLTNGRTTIVMACLLLGGVVFTALRRPNWKGLLVALLAGVLTVVLAFAGSTKIYDANEERLLRQYAAAETASTEAAQAGREDGETAVVVSPQGSWENDIRTLNGRTYIWKAAIKGLEENQNLLLWGTEYVGMILSRYNPFETVHTHNSWLEALYRLGLPGFVVALVLTIMALRDILLILWRGNDPWKSCIALLMTCLLGCAMLEPYLFVADVSYYYLDFLFLFCLGCMNEWCAS